jgi:hypothetical protein
VKPAGLLKWNAMVPSAICSRRRNWTSNVVIVCLPSMLVVLWVRRSTRSMGDKTLIGALVVIAGLTELAPDLIRG